MEKKPVMLMILDGFGINEKEDGNAVKLANTPNIDKLMKKFQTTKIYTSGLKVGLPDGQMGNSEVGHTNIGAGRIVYQELTKITKSIEDGNFFAIPEFIEAIENCKKYNSKLHILGLVSDGGVHSHIRHLYGLLEMAKRRDFENVYVHCFLDGRDTPPASAENYITQLEEKMREKGIGKIASLSGRYYAMDRDKRWDRVKKCYDALVNGEGKIKEIPADIIAKYVCNLGAGRVKKEDKIDMAVGIILSKKNGDSIKEGEKILTIHSNKKIEDANLETFKILIE